VGARGAGGRNEGGGRGAGCRGRAGCWDRTPVALTHPLGHGIGRRGVGDGCALLLSLSFVGTLFPSLFPRCVSHLLAEGGGELATSRLARTADRKRAVHNSAVIYIGRTRTMVKQKNKKQSDSFEHLGGRPCFHSFIG